MCFTCGNRLLIVLIHHILSCTLYVDMSKDEKKKNLKIKKRYFIFVGSISSKLAARARASKTTMEFIPKREEEKRKSPAKVSIKGGKEHMQ